MAKFENNPNAKIVMFPVLISPNVSSMPVAGLVKELEKFILLYRLEDIRRLVVKQLSTGITFFENTEVNPKSVKISKIKRIDSILNEQMSRDRDAMLAIAPPEDREEIIDAEFEEIPQPAQPNQQAQEPGIGITGSTIHMNDLVADDSKNLLPTFMHIDVEYASASGNKIKMPVIIGVKVVPFFVKDVRKALLLLKTDGSSGIISAFIKRKLRQIWNNTVMHIYKKVLKFFGSDYLTGDPKKDIIYGLSRYNKNIFMLFNYKDLSFKNTNLVNSMKFIDRAHRLGWNSLLFADDTNRVVYFCMEEFGGTCSAVPYSALYTAAKKRETVYKELSDLHKSASPFYRKKVSLRKVLSESKNKKLDLYLEQLDLLDKAKEEDNEELKSLVYKLSNEMGAIKTERDLQKFYKRYKFLARGFDSESYKKAVRKRVKEFDSVYNKVYMALENSLEAFSKINNEKVKEIFTTLIILVADLAKKTGKMTGSLLKIVGQIIYKLAIYLKGERTTDQFLMIIAGLMLIIYPYFVSWVQILTSPVPILFFIIGVILVLNNLDVI
ncbi:MAG: hypothetical protein KatS3mg002_0456 [Candidatus Woesearchaeota archaeon]|nr:MAG: hypothetical protein KatS3mg002_0456 [Candidatus Woesearchaeota archaeon]